MAQLSDDCFAFGGPMMSVDEAVGLITTRVNAIADLETVALVDADGRVLARDIAAPLPLPPFTNSAVDGYAVRDADLPDSAERAFPLDGRIQAGGLVQAPIRPGHTARIFTGAPMPPDAGTVFMQEDVRIDDAARIVLPPGLKPGANVRPAGEDIPQGHVALRAGQRLRPQHVALAAAFGLTRIDVVRRIRVAVFSTGDELASPGEPRAASQLFDSNRFMLMAMLRRLGGARSAISASCVTSGLPSRMA
ncbi:molybdopterin biosynthesis enzyme [Bradyrhizobium diazoefficiens]